MLALAIGALVCVQCESPVVEKQAPAPPPVKIGFNEEEGFKDLNLSAREVKQNADSVSVLAAASLDGQKVEMEVLVPNKWSESKLGDDADLLVRGGGLTLRRTGTASDSFVQTLAKYYGVKQAPKAMRDSVDVAAVVLGGNPKNLLKERVQIKIFFNADSEKENEYGEAFLNIDLPGKLVQFNEKDPEYRAPIIAALGR